MNSDPSSNRIWNRRTQRDPCRRFTTARITTLTAITATMFFGFASFSLATSNIQSQVPSSSSPEKDDGSPNRNSVLKAHAGKVKISASTFYNGWQPANLIDGDLHSSWFSATGDSAANGSTPWIELEFPPTTVRRVTILGNREKSYPKGYFVLEGTLELGDKTGKRLWFGKQKSQGAQHDFNFRLPGSIANVHTIRFTSTKDEGHINGSKDVALGEVQVE